MRVVENVAPRYQVQLGESVTEGWSQEVAVTHYGFSKAFDELDDARAYARYLAEDNLFVRIVDIEGDADV